MRLNLKRKLMIAMLSVLALSLTALTLSTYTLMRTDLEQKLSQAYDASIVQLSEQLSPIFRELRQTANAFASNETLVDLLLEYEQAEDELLKPFIKVRICNLLSKNAENYAIAYNTILFSGDTLFLSDSQDLFYHYDVTDALAASFQAPERITYENLGWYDHTQMFDETLRGPFFYTMRRVRNPMNGDTLGVLRTGFSHAYITHMLQGVLTSEQRVCIANPQGRVIASSDSQYLETVLPGFAESNALGRYVTEAEQYYVSPIEGTPWFAVGIAPLQSLRAQNNTLPVHIVLIALGCMAVSFFIAHFIASKMTRNIHAMMKAAAQIEQGNFDIVVPVNTKDELGMLGGAMTHMSARLKSLMQDLLRKEGERKEAEARFLRAQINPHFLHNTLKTVTALAEQNRTEEISEVVVSLSDILKETMTWDSKMITLQQEIELLKSFLRIMEARHDYMFDFAVDINPYLNPVLIPRLTLQPFVENSIFHGMRQDAGEYFRIRISADYDEADHHRVRIVIADNGKGIEPSRLAMLQGMLDNPVQTAPDRQSVGISNVAQRLRYYYEDAEILLDSEWGAGTTVCISFHFQTETAMDAGGSDGGCENP